jgi:hypothetical protein
VVACSAATGLGVDGVLAAVAAHRAHLEARGLDRVRLEKRAEQVAHAVCEGLCAELLGPKGWSRHVRAELAGGAAPHELGRAVLQAILARVPEAPPVN